MLSPLLHIDLLPLFSPAVLLFQQCLSQLIKVIGKNNEYFRQEISNRSKLAKSLSEEDDGLNVDDHDAIFDADHPCMVPYDEYKSQINRFYLPLIHLFYPVF